MDDMASVRIMSEGKREGSTMQNTMFDRRAFLAGATIGAASVAGMAAQLGTAIAEEPAPAADSVETTYDGMTLAQLNEFRHQLVAAQTDYTCEDGTVIPAVYVKMRALYNSYSFGIGSQLHDHCFDQFIYLYTEDLIA